MKLTMSAANIQGEEKGGKASLKDRIKRKMI
jgi:hypothetical protein